MSSPYNRRCLAALLALGAVVPSPALALAEWKPTKPVRMIVTFPPGGPSEIVARLVSEQLQAALNQPFVVESRPGAGGNIGAEAVAKSPPDGHVFGITTDTLFTINPLVYASMPVDPWRDLVPVTLLGRFSQMMVCNPQVAAKSLGDLLALARRERLTYASGGPGVPGHLAAELMLSMAQVDMVHVPFKGPAAAAPYLERSASQETRRATW